MENESALGSGLWAGGGGVSTVYATPTWQTGTGVPSVDPGTSASHHRYVPDVALSAASHDGYVVMQEGTLYLVGGTSAASPSFAGIMALINQKTNGRNGLANTRLYSLAAQTPSVFHDVSSGNDDVPCVSGSASCTGGFTTGFSAGAGFDLATGWGSVDANALASGGARPVPPRPLRSLRR